MAGNLNIFKNPRIKTVKASIIDHFSLSTTLLLLTVTAAVTIIVIFCSEETSPLLKARRPANKVRLLSCYILKWGAEL